MSRAFLIVLGQLVSLTGLAALALVATAQWLPAGVASLAILRIPPFAYFVTGLFAGGLLALATAGIQWSFQTVMVLLILSGAGLSVALGHPVLHASMAAALAIVAVAAGYRVMTAVDDGDTIGITSYWGGLGGGLGGWQVSRATAFFLVLLVAALAAVALMWPALAPDGAGAHAPKLYVGATGTGA